MRLVLGLFVVCGALLQYTHIPFWTDVQLCLTGLVCLALIGLNIKFTAFLAILAQLAEAEKPPELRIIRNGDIA